jgi:hypothetical protein
MENEELKQAEDHLKQAEADLEAGKTAERAAEHEIEEAVHEIREAEEHQHHRIHFLVDGEEEETNKHELTANQIISEYGKKDPSSNYLVEIHGTEKKSYQGKGDEKIKLHDGMSFQIVSTGPTPLSDVSCRTGTEVFVEGLSTLGYEPNILPKFPDPVFFDYRVEIGPFVGRTVRLGFVVPPDFPNTSPSGPHVSPHIQPIHPAQDVPHPKGGVHQGLSQLFQQGAGGDWQYWSRPFPDWTRSKKTVTAYMTHIWRLWETQ